MRLNTVVALAMLSIATVNAQNTWHNLSYDMTVDDVTKALNEYKLQLDETVNKYSKYMLLPYFDLYNGQGDGTIKFPMQVNLFFAKETGKLEHVSLAFVVQPTDQVTADTKSLALLALASAHMVSDLKAKYGMPQEEQGICPIKGRDLVSAKFNRGYCECKVTWRQTGQVIELQQTVFNDSGKLTAYYLLNYDHPKSQL